MERGKQRGPETDPKDRGRLRRLQREVSRVMQSDDFVDSLVEARTDEKAMAALKANPRAHLKSKRVTVPDEVDVEVTEESSICVTLCFYWWWIRVCCRACIF